MPMTDAVARLAEARRPVDAQPAIDDCLQKARGGQLGLEDRRAFLHNLVFNEHFLAAFTTST